MPRWLLVDIDPIRPAGISSNDVELESAHLPLEELTGFLSGQGWPEPVTAMSGNGYYALYRIDLRVDQESLDLIREVLSALARKFNTSEAHVDQAVGNAARMVGLVGTLKVKGDEIPGRRHRRSRLESVPEKLLPVTKEQLTAVASLARKPTSKESLFLKRLSGIRLDDLLRQHNIDLRQQPADAQGITWYHVRQCPFHDDGRPFECGVEQKAAGWPLRGEVFSS